MKACLHQLCHTVRSTQLVFSAVLIDQTINSLLIYLEPYIFSTVLTVLYNFNYSLFSIIFNNLMLSHLLRKRKIIFCLPFRNSEFRIDMESEDEKPLLRPNSSWSQSCTKSFELKTHETNLDQEDSHPAGVSADDKDSLHDRSSMLQFISSTTKIDQKRASSSLI